VRGKNGGFRGFGGVLRERGAQCAMARKPELGETGKGLRGAFFARFGECFRVESLLCLVEAGSY
jgi:hypothetical protein